MEFGRNFSTYDDNAIVQKEVAEKLANLINDKFKNFKINSTIELGCGTGIFTKKYLEKIRTIDITLNDFFDTKEYLKSVNYKKFIQGDMREAVRENYDIIVSSSSFQWIENLEEFIEKISKNTEKLAFSIYLEDNLFEIKKYFGIGLNYKTSCEIEKILKKYFNSVDMFEEKRVLEFTNPLESLRHLKKTGVSIGEKSPISKVRNFKEKKLTYHIGYFLCDNAKKK